MNSLDMSVGLKVCTGVGVQVGTLKHASTAFYLNTTRPSSTLVTGVGGKLKQVYSVDWETLNLNILLHQRLITPLDCMEV